MHAQSIPWLHFSLRVKAKLVTVAYKGPAVSSSSDPLYLLLLSSGSLCSCHTGLLALLFCWIHLLQGLCTAVHSLKEALLIRYFPGPLPHFLHTFDQCHHLSEAMSCIFPFLSDLSLLCFLPHDILLHLLIFCWSPSKIYAT